MSILRTWIGATRPKTLTAAVAPIVLASALAHRMGAFVPRVAGLCLVFAVLVQVVANFANEYFDALKGTDASRPRNAPLRAVAAGLIAPRAMLGACIGVALLALGVGSCLLRWGPALQLGLVGFASITAAVAYTAGPYPLGYKGLGDVFVFIFFGLVAVGLTFYLQTQRWVWEAAALGVAQGCLAVNLLVITSYRDIDADARCGKKTLGVRWGRRFLEGQYLFGFLTPMVLAAVFAMHYRYSLAMLLPWLLFPMGYNLISDLRRLQEHFDFDRGLKTTSFIMMAYAVLVATALCVSR